MLLKLGCFRDEQNMLSTLQHHDSAGLYQAFQYVPGKKPIRIPESKLLQSTPTSLMLDALPVELANEILRLAVKASRDWPKTKRIVWEREV
jgi:hypothetical protein